MSLNLVVMVFYGMSLDRADFFVFMATWPTGCTLVPFGITLVISSDASQEVTARSGILNELAPSPPQLDPIASNNAL